MMKKKFIFIITRGLDGYYIGTVPELPGAITQAETVGDIFPRIKEAIEAYLEAMEEEVESISEEFQLIGVNQIEVELG